MLNKKINNYFLFLFSLLPVSIIAGSSISLANILLIDISFLILILFRKDFDFIKSKSVRYLLILYLYLIFNSLISLNYEIGLARNLGFIRFVILFVAFNYFFQEKSFLRNTLYIWSLVIIFVLLDVFYESYFGKNILGFGGDAYGNRIVSFFKDEPIVGGYIFSFYLITLGFLFYEFNEKKNLIVLFSIIFLTAIILTGERSNTIKSILGIFLFYLILREYDFKKKIVFFIITTLFCSALVYNSDYLITRFYYQIKIQLTQQTKQGPAPNLYYSIYRSGYEVFKEHKLFGVGNKNYRVKTCKAEEKDKIDQKIYYCTTHPHQIYFELLSEHGLVGTILLLFIFYQLIFSKFRKIFERKNYLQLGSFIYILITFLPLLPGGAFFGDYMLTMFMLNLSIFYASNEGLNIFSQHGKKIEN